MTDKQAGLVTEFRREVIARLATDDRFGAAQTDDRDDGSTLITRWPVGEGLYLEVALRPFLPQLRVGVVTEDRWKSEEVEQAIQDSGDSMEEYLELALSEAGLEWEDPPVEHYRHEGKWFSFITPLDLESLDELSDDRICTKAMQMIEAYSNSYGRL